MNKQMYGNQNPEEKRHLSRRTFLGMSVLLGGVGAVLVGQRLTSSSASQSDGESPTARPIQDDDGNFSRRGWATDFSTHSVPLSEISSGGPGKDGIPPIDEPKFVSIDEANEWLGEDEPVVVVVIDGGSGPVARGYPIQILMWHEIVNDELAGMPIAITFCPLCNTAIAFDRKLPDDETIYDFGTTGNLRHSDLVMWDRQTESWWQQITGEAIVGELTGAVLTQVPAQILGWSTFKAQYPEADVLSQDTGFGRAYGQNPYVGYDSITSSPFLFRQEADGRYPPMQRIVGVDQGGEQVAYIIDSLIDPRVANDTVGETDVAILLAPGVNAATDNSEIAEARDVGQIGVFERSVDGRVLTFESSGDTEFKDAETGTTWSVAGEAIDGPLAGTSLSGVPHVVVFWFAWAVSFPDTRIWS